MALKLSERLEETKVTRVYFDEAKTKFIDVKHRIHAMAYGRKQRLMETVYSIQGKSKQIKELQRVLEDTHRPQQDREQAQKEMLEISQDVRLLTPPLVDYLAGTTGNPPRPAAVVSWDLLDANNDPLMITREIIEEELDEEMISTIAWALLGDTAPGESNADGSKQQFEHREPEASTVPA